MQASALLIDAPEGARLLGISERSFHNLRKRDDFPRPVTGLLASRIVRWRRANIEAFVANLPTAPVALEEPECLARGRIYKSGALLATPE